MYRSFYGLATSFLPPSNAQPSSLRLNRGRNRMDLKDSLQQIGNDLILVLLPGDIDLLDLHISLLVGFVFGRLVALCMLYLQSVYRSDPGD